MITTVTLCILCLLTLLCLLAQLMTPLVDRYIQSCQLRSNAGTSAEDLVVENAISLIYSERLDTEALLATLSSPLPSVPQ